ncbi:hypothetical protein ABK040_010970 [Willaertia magna]
MSFREKFDSFVKAYKAFGLRIFGPKVLLAYLFIINLFIYFDRGCISGMLESLEKQWKISESEQGALGSAFMVGYMIFGPIFAQLASKFEMKYIIFIGLCIWCVVTAACGFSGLIPAKSGYYLLAVCRALVGVGEAAYAPIACTLLDDAVPPKHRTLYISIFYVALPAGVALGYGVSSLFAAYLHWTLVFFIEGAAMIPLSLLMLVVPSQEDYRKDRKEKEGLLQSEERPIEEIKDKTERTPIIGQETNNNSILDENLGEENTNQVTPQNQDRKYNIFQAIYSLLTNSVYLFALLGYTMYTFVIGALSFWGPSLVAKNLGISHTTGSLGFSAVSVVTGLIGSMLGGVILDLIGGSKGMIGCARALLLCSIYVLISMPFGYLAFLFRTPVPFFIFLFLAELAVFCITSPVNVAFLTVVSPNLRNYSMSFQIFTIHALGDFPSPYAVGAVADFIGKRTGLIKTFYILWSVLVLAVIFFFFGALVARSKSKLPQWREKSLPEEEEEEKNPEEIINNTDQVKTI